jgi:hypothetical protein
MRSTLALFLGMAASTIGAAQPLSFRGPVEGFVFDLPTRSLRAVNGFPGSAYFGPALLDGVDFASVAPRQSYAIAFRGGDCQLVYGLDAGNVWTATIPGITAVPEGIHWSGDRAVAVLYSQRGNWLQSISGLPDNPVAGALVDLSSLGGPLSAVAVDRRGKQIAVGIRGGHSGVLSASDGQSFAMLLEMPDPIAITFSDDGSSLFALARDSSQLTAFRVADNSSRAIALDGLTDPFAVRYGRDSQNRELIYIASRSDRLLRIYDFAAGQIVSDVPLDFEPTGLEELGRTSIVVAARAHDVDPLWLFNSNPQPAVYFVPALQVPSGGTQ